MNNELVIPIQVKISILEEMIKEHDELAQTWRFHPGLCSLYNKALNEIFVKNTSNIVVTQPNWKEIFTELIGYVFEDLDDCLMRRRAVQDFEAREDTAYWWKTSQFQARRDFLVNAIEVLKFRLKSNK